MYLIKQNRVTTLLEHNKNTQNIHKKYKMLHCVF